MIRNLFILDMAGVHLVNAKSGIGTKLFIW
jgi:hypothetical protein